MYTSMRYGGGHHEYFRYLNDVRMASRGLINNIFRAFQIKQKLSEKCPSDLSMEIGMNSRFGSSQHWGRDLEYSKVFECDRKALFIT